jgi:5-carboxymethyl-2-hydroxymuconic-semialdehyde dehydrogenase
VIAGAEITRALERLGYDTLGHFIDGCMTEEPRSARFHDRSPIDDSLLSRVALGGEAEIDAAALSATRAFAGWRARSGEERRKILNAIACAILERSEEIAYIESIDTGQPIRFTAKAAERAAENFRFFADRAPSASDGLALPAPGQLNYTVRQPIGPIGVITPWNTPFMLSTWKIAPALAAGCTVVHKPAEWSPLSAMLLAQIATDAGLPPGVLNVVNGDERAGKALTEHPAIRAIAFVGESTTGSLIMAQGAPTLKRVHFELGGKNPVIIFDDADVERALDAAIFMIYSLNGERCTSSSRALVQSSLYDAFVERLASRARTIRVGHPLDPQTEVGPLIHPEHRDKVLAYCEIGKREGAVIAAGGGAPRGMENGNYVSPTLFTHAGASMRIAQEEIFGPVLTAIPFRDEAEAIAIANGVRYGLAAYVWTRDLERAHRVAHSLEAGMVWINSSNVRHLPAPFGGMKASGIGRDGGDYSFDFYMETKNVCVTIEPQNTPRLGVQT